MKKVARITRICRRMAAAYQRAYARALYRQGRIDDDTRASMEALAADYERQGTKNDDRNRWYPHGLD